MIERGHIKGTTLWHPAVMSQGLTLTLWAHWPLLPRCLPLLIIILTPLCKMLYLLKIGESWWKMPLLENETKECDCFWFASPTSRYSPCPHHSQPCFQLRHCPDPLLGFYWLKTRRNPSSCQQIWALPEWMAVFHPTPSTMWRGKEDEGKGTGLLP